MSDIEKLDDAPQRRCEIANPVPLYVALVTQSWRRPEAHNSRG